MENPWQYVRLFVTGLVHSSRLCNCKNGHGESKRFGKLLCLKRFLLPSGIFLPTNGKTQLMQRYFLPQGPEMAWGTFFLPLVFLGIRNVPSAESTSSCHELPFTHKLQFPLKTTRYFFQEAVPRNFPWRQRTTHYFFQDAVPLSSIKQSSKHAVFLL